MDDQKFFKESAFDELYEGTFFVDEFPRQPPDTSKADNSAEAAEISAATSKVRMSTELEVNQQVNRAISSNYALGGNFGGSMPAQFMGKIFGDI